VKYLQHDVVNDDVAQRHTDTSWQQRCSEADM